MIVNMKLYKTTEEDGSIDYFSNLSGFLYFPKKEEISCQDETNEKRR